MEAGPSSGAAAERQPRIEDETPSEAAAPTVTIVEREAEVAAADDNASRPRSESRPRLRNQPSSNSSSGRADRSSYLEEEDEHYSRKPRISLRDDHGPRRIRGYSPAGYRYREYSSRSRSREYSPRGRSQSPSEWSRYDIDLDGDESRSPDEPLPQEWTQPRTILEDGTATELIVAQSIEHRLSKSGLERIVLLSPSRPPPSSGSTGQEREKSRVQFRWLHVQPNTPETDDVEPVFQALEHQFLSLETGPVLFLGTMGVDRLHAQTLLRDSRGYDVGDERELSQVARKMGVGAGVTFCTLLCCGIMITLCCLPSTDLRRDLIEIDDRAGRGFYTVQVKLQDRELCHSIVIDPDCSYVDFLQHAVAVATSGTQVRDAAKYDILYGPQTSGDAEKLEQLEVLTPSRWLKLLGSDRVENHTFHLKPKCRARSRSRRPYHREQHSPHFIRRSRRLPPSIRRRSSYREPSRLRSPVPAPTRYGYSDVTGRGQSHNDKAVVVYKRDRKAISRVDSEERSEPIFVRDTHAHRHDLDSNQTRRTAGEIVIRRRSETRRERPPVPLNSDLETERYVEVRRRSTDRYSSDDNSPVIERERGIVRRRRSSSTGSDTRWHRGRSPWLRRREREYDSDSNDTPAAEQETPPLDDSGAVTVAPFFAWRVKSMADMDTVSGDQNDDSTSPMTDAAIHNLFRILGKINESLLSSESGIREVYSQAYKCTEENLLKRHPDLTRDMVPGLNTSPTVQRDGAGQDADQEKKGDPADRNGSTQPPATSPPDLARVGSASQEQDTARQEKIGPSNTGDKQVPATSQADPQGSAGHSTSVMLMHPADAFGKQLLEISQAIMGRFLPKDEHSIYHSVCERFWGSVDEAIRQVRWSTEPSGALWTIRDVDTMSGAAGGSGGVTAKKSYAGCTACSMATKYPSASVALQHLHTTHLECPLGEPAAGKTKDRPQDDPCYTYIKSLTDTHSNEPEIENIAKEFINHLSDFSGSLNKIQWLIATNSQDNPHRRRSGPNLPQLPRSLVYAFDELVSYYILQAKRLSLQNRGISLNARNNANLESFQALNRSERLALRCHGIRARLQSYLQQARRDVILSRGAGHGGVSGAGGDDDADTAALGVQAFDTTSFMRSLIRSVLDTTFSAPLPPKKTAGTGASVVTGRREVGKHTIQVWDVVGMYSEYSKHLHVEAARRPRRRLFLDIHALEDELVALKAHLDTNLYMINLTLDNFPESDKVFTGRRWMKDVRSAWKRRYRETRTMEVEWYYLLGRRDAVQAKLDELQNLQKSASALRERVRQLIEITDEDHGKAIRVFTMVTVLFLPMTFVSGFFGMNTVDIRDIGATQSLYWTIAVPVTIVVLAIALAYGYKGDEIGDWIRDRISLWKSNRVPRSAEVAAQRKPQSSAADGRWVKWAGTDAGTKEVWKTVRNSVRRRKRRQDMDMTRKSTFQSDILP
ncbi:Magnesium transport protein CorA [Madurella mycetomatis]|uniref:Magnesium transport protein CorA n=1 Tax=Madurella mycetomatis TaxID=100816 RepID=A0A175VYF9_9PEZI|nr:Magnesium transport protein CorA [Madurella mycetomatis]